MSQVPLTLWHSDTQLLKTARSEVSTLHEGMILDQQWCSLASTGASWASSGVPVMSWHEHCMSSHEQQHSVRGTLSIIPQRAPYVALIQPASFCPCLPLNIFCLFFLSMPSPQQHPWKLCSPCLLSPQDNPSLCFHFSLPLPDSVRVSETSQHWSASHSPTAGTRMALRGILKGQGSKHSPCATGWHPEGKIWPQELAVTSSWKEGLITANVELQMSIFLCCCN